MVSEGNTLLVCGTKPTPLRDELVGACRFGDVVAAERDRARAHLDQAEEGLEQGRLAGAVRADDADQLALAGVEAQPLRMLTPGR